MKKILPTQSKTLRRLAEEQLKATSSQRTQLLTEADMLKLIHELEVHQIELELQNEELLQLKLDHQGTARKYEELFDHAPSGYVTLTEDGKITGVNLAGARMLGKEGCRLKYRPFGFFVATSSRPLFTLFLSNLFTTGRNETCSLRMVSPEAAPVHVHLAGVRNQSLDECMVTITEISSLLRSKEELVQSEDRYKSLFNANHSVMLIIDPESGAIRDANVSACLYYGWSHEEICKKQITDINTLSHSEVLAEMKKAKGEKRKNFNFVHRLATGEVRDVEVYSGPIRFGSEKLLYSLVHDITRRKVAENALKMSEEKYRLLVENQNELVVKVDPEGKFVFVSPSYCSLLGKSEPELEGTPFFSTVHQEDIEISRAALMDINKPPFSCYFEHRAMTVDGWCWLAWSGKAIRDKKNRILSIVGVGRNITERKLTEEALYESRMELTALNRQLENAQLLGHTGSWVYHIATREITGSKEANRLFGFAGNHAQFTLAGFEACIPERKRVHQALVDLIKNGTPYDLEYVVNPADGSIPRIITSKASLELDTDGNPVAVNGVIQDITVSRNKEEQVRESSHKWNALVSTSPDGIGLFSLDGKLKFASDRLAEIYGYSPDEKDEFIGAPVHNFIDASCHGKVLENLNKLVSGTIVNNFTEYLAIRKDQTRFNVELYSTLLYDANGKPGNVLYVERDITARKEAEETLRKSESLYRAILDASPDTIAITDLEGHILMSSPSGWKMFGYDSLDEMKQLSILDFIAQEDHPRARMLIEQMFDGLFAGVGGYHGIRADGSIFYIEVNGNFIRDKEGRPTNMVFVVRDITDRRHAEDNLRISEQRFLKAAEQTQTVIWEVDADGLYTYVSKHAKVVWGYDPSELTGKKYFYDLHPEKGREQFKKIAGEAFERRDVFQNFPNQVVTGDGQVILMETNGTPLVDDQNNLIGYLGSDIDVTARKKAEVDILNKTNLLANLIINMQEGVLLEDSNRKIILTNQLFCDLFGIPVQPNEMVGADCSNSAEQSKGIFKNSEKFITDIVKILEARKAVLNDELELADGRHFERDYIPTYIDNVYNGHLWKYRDVTERKKTERAIYESELKYRNLVENISDVLYEIDAQGEIRYISPTIEKILGYTSAEITGRNFRHFVGVSADFLIDRLTSLAENSTLENEYKLLTRDGQVRWVRLSTRALFHQEVFAGGSGTLIDITERKFAEEKLTKSEEGYRKLSRAVEQSLSMTVITDLAGKIEYVNPKVMEITGYSQHELVGENARMFSSGEKPRAEYDEMWNKIRSGNEWKGEFHNKKKNGELYWVLAAITPILDMEGKITHYLANEEDITSRKQAEKELTESEERLNYAQEIAGMGSWTFNIATGKYKWSRNNYKMAGLQPFEREITPDFFMNMIHPDDAGELSRRVGEVNVTREPIDMEIRIILPDGSIRWLQNYIVPVFQGDDMVGLNGVNLDITGKKLDEDRIRLQNERLNAIVTAMPDLIFVMDEAGNNLEHYTNTPEKLFISGDQIFGTNISTFFDEETTSHHLSNISACIREQRLITYDYAVPETGMLSCYEARLAPLGSDKVLAFVRDITNRKQAEREIKELNETLALTVDQRTAQLAATNRELKLEIGERIRVSAGLEEALDRLHKIADRVPGMVYQYRLRPDESSCFPFASEGIQGIYRVSPGQVAEDAAAVLSRIHPDDQEQVIASIRASARDLTLWRQQYRVRFEDETVRWLSGNAFPQREPDGSVLWHGFISDITDRKLAEEELQESQNRFLLFMDYLPAIVFIKDSDGRTIYVNKTMDIALGASKWLGLTLPEIFDMEMAARILEDDRSTIKMGYKKVEESFLHLDGTLHHYETQKFMLPAAGKHPLLGGIAVDITERRQAEDELKQLSTRLSMATRAGGVGVWDMDVEHNILIWDNQMMELYGIDKKNFVGAYETWVTGVHPDDRERGDAEINAAIAGKKEFDTEFRVVWPDGTVRNIKAQAVVQRDAAGRALHMIGTNWDVTLHKRALAFEKELLRLSMQLTGIRGSGIMSSIDLALGSIGDYLGIDRAYIFEFSHENTRMTNSHEWCNAGIKPNMGKFGEIPIDLFPFPIELLRQHQDIVIPSARLLPESRKAEREILESYGIKTVIVLPIIIDDNLVGMVGLNTEINEREYDSLELYNLRVWSNILAGLIHNQRNEVILEQTRTNYETFFNTIDDFLFVLDVRGNIIHVNNTVQQRLGYPINDLMGQPVLMVHPEERREEAGRIVGEMLAGTADFCPVPLLTRTGSYIPVETRVKPGYWDGNPVIFGVSKDVSKIKLSEEKFSKAFQSNSTLMGISGFTDGAFIDVNEAFHNTLEYSREEIIGNTAHLLGLFVDTGIRSLMIEKILQNQPVRDFETQVRTKSGRILTGLLSAEMIHIGKDLCMLTVMVDITGRKHAEELLQAKMALLEAQKNATPDGILVIDGHGKRILMNSRMVEIFQLPPLLVEDENDAGLLRHVMDLTKYPDEFLQKVLFLYEHVHQTSRDEIELKNGMVLDRYSAPVLGTDGKSYGRIWSFRDITERKHTEQEIIRARNEADKANLAKSEFLSRMSHELRTPMNSILGFAQLLDMGELTPGHRKGVHHILNSGKHLLNLINEVLDISRIEAGRLALSMEPIQARSVIMEMIEVVLPAAADRGQVMEMEPSSTGLLFVRADRQRLRQVLLNLINNAVKYNGEGGSVIVKTSLNLESFPGIPMIRISIVDSGPGIKPEDIGKLFLPFQRIGAEKTMIEGTGLGLALVKELMDAMDGRVGVDSIPGEGSTFWIELPQVEDRAGTPGNGGDGLKALTKTTGISGTILYIEDNVPNAELVEGILVAQRPGIRLVTSMFGNSAVAFATGYNPGMILLDLDLPDIQGSEVLANLQANEATRHLPVVIISADATQRKIEMLKNAGACEYLSKPLDIATFLEVVDKYLEKPGKN